MIFNILTAISNIEIYVQYIQIHVYGFELYYKMYTQIYLQTDMGGQGQYITIYLKS